VKKREKEKKKDVSFYLGKKEGFVKTLRLY
jgi:hypothetical protein